MALFVVQNSRPLKFYLLGLKKSEYDKYKKLITDNGGEVSPTGDYPVINFSMPGCFQNKKFVFHVFYIEECIKKNRILNLVDFKISETNDYEGCPVSSLIFGSPQCKLVFASKPSALPENNKELQHNKSTKDTKPQKYMVKNSIDEPLEININLVECTDDDENGDNENGDDENGNDEIGVDDADVKNRDNKDSDDDENENFSDKKKMIEKNSVNKQNSSSQSANSSTEVHQSNIITTEHTNIDSTHSVEECGIGEMKFVTKVQNTPQSNKKSNSSDCISPQSSQSEFTYEPDLITNDEMEIVPENSTFQSLDSTMMKVISDDENSNDDKNGDNNKNNANEHSSDKKKMIEKNSVNEQTSSSQSANSSAEVHQSNVITTEHTNKDSTHSVEECGIEETKFETKVQNTPQSNEKSNSSDSISPQFSQSEFTYEPDLITNDEMEIVPENSTFQSLDSTMMKFISDDENQDKVFIDNDKSFTPSAYKTISKKENDSSVSDNIHTDCNTSNDSIVSNTTDDLSDSPVNVRYLSSTKYFNLRLMKE